MESENFRKKLKERLNKGQLLFYNIGDKVKHREEGLEGRVVCITYDYLSKFSKELMAVRIKTKDGDYYEGRYPEFKVTSYAKKRKRVPIFIDDEVSAENLESIELFNPVMIEGLVYGLRIATEPWHYSITDLIEDPKIKEIHEEMDKNYDTMNHKRIRDFITNPQRYIAMVLDKDTCRFYDVPLNMLKLLATDKGNKIFKLP